MSEVLYLLVPFLFIQMHVAQNLWHRIPIFLFPLLACDGYV